MLEGYGPAAIFVMFIVVILLAAIVTGSILYGISLNRNRVPSTLGDPITSPALNLDLNISSVTIGSIQSLVSSTLNTIGGGDPSSVYNATIKINLEKTS